LIIPLAALPARPRMARSNGMGAETARPFAVAIIGGLITGTVLTRFILPVLYPVFEPARPPNACRRGHRAVGGRPAD